LLEHGGRLRAVAARYDRPLAQWLDLSTGINPWGWPAPPIPAGQWLRLPEEGDGLEAAAQAYYGVDALLPVAGSQAAIQMLPRLRAPSTVGVLSPSYSEHYQAWKGAGHEVLSLSADAIAGSLARLDVLVICRPNNPDGLLLEADLLLTWRQQLAARGGWLVVDEAFVDAQPELSLAPHSGEEGLILLRSLGKFFGLAGARVGFVLARPHLLEVLAERLGPWTISGPSRQVARGALSDIQWQARMRPQLQQASERLARLLTRHGLAPVGGTPLFQLVAVPQAERLYERLASQGVLVRLFRELSCLRFGLPGDASQWRRLARVLANGA